MLVDELFEGQTVATKTVWSKKDGKLEKKNIDVVAYEPFVRRERIVVKKEDKDAK